MPGTSTTPKQTISDLTPPPQLGVGARPSPRSSARDAPFPSLVAPELRPRRPVPKLARPGAPTPTPSVRRRAAVRFAPASTIRSAPAPRYDWRDGKMDAFQVLNSTVAEMVAAAVEDMYRELPPRPTPEEVEAAAAVLALADAEEGACLTKIAQEEDDIPCKLVAVLLWEAKCSAVQLRALHRRQEATRVLQLERRFEVLDDLIQRVLLVVSCSEGCGSAGVGGDSVVEKVGQEEMATAVAKDITRGTKATFSPPLAVSAVRLMDEAPQQPTTMSDKCNNKANDSIEDLDESIVIWEILVRLPAKNILRCRAVCKSWRRATSTHDFMLAHHRQQPSLPVVQFVPIHDYRDVDLGMYPDLVTSRNPRLAVLCNRNLRPLVQYAAPSDGYMDLHATCDGLLLVSNTSSGYDRRCFYICNPATRSCNALMQISETAFGPSTVKINVVGFYGYKSGEYRVLYCVSMDWDVDISEYYIWTVGSNKPRSIGDGAPTDEISEEVRSGLLAQRWHDCINPPVIYRKCLHWNINGILVVFNTEEETFRGMYWPAPDFTLTCVWSNLMEMNDTLGLCIYNIECEDAPFVKFWVLRDYEAELWDFKYRINLSEVVAPLAQPFQDNFYSSTHLRATLISEREVLIQVCGSMFVCDLDGKVLKNVKRDEEMYFQQITWHWYKESILPLPEVQGPFLCVYNDLVSV
ncbi:hypothetical protein EJB05_39844, partial [Eragrostis curvula]